MGCNILRIKKREGKHKTLKKNLLLTAFLLSGIIMIGHGARMIYQGVFVPYSYYRPALFDIFFDWTTLLILGFIIFGFSIRSFYTNIKLKQKYKETAH